MGDEHCESFVSDCHVRAAVDLIDHAWDAVVLSALRLGPTRRNLLLHRIAGISDKVLTDSLRRLASRDLVTRTAADSRRDTAVYELTELGNSFARGPLAQLAKWAADNHAALSATS